MMAPKMDVTGTVISLSDSRISAEVEGVLEWIAEVGTEVSEGDVIAEINDRLLSVNFRRADAALKRLKADLNRRREAVKRFQGLAENNNASQARLEEVVADLDMLFQDIADAEAVLDRARGDLERTKVRARFSGNIVERLASVGEYISVDEEVLRLVDTHSIEITLPAPIAITPYLSKGMAIAVRNGGLAKMLTVRTIVPVGDILSRQVEVRLSAEAGDWVIGAPVTVSLPRNAPSVQVAVSRDAIIRKGSKLYLYRINGDSKAEQLAVKLEAIDGLWISTTGSDLKAGDKIVLRGGERLQPGQKVLVKAP
jgi:RND family efflux transporter MFP subunit